MNTSSLKFNKTCYDFIAILLSIHNWGRAIFKLWLSWLKIIIMNSDPILFQNKISIMKSEKIIWDHRHLNMKYKDKTNWYKIYEY